MRSILAEMLLKIAREAKYLSWLVKRQLGEYDREILESSAILMDASWWECLLCWLGCLDGVVVACSACCVCVDWIVTYPIDMVCSMIVRPGINASNLLKRGATLKVMEYLGKDVS